jgi:hypothetical protein
VLRRIFGPKRTEAAGSWRRLHNAELHNLYTSPDTRVIRSRRMRWAGQVAHTEEIINAYIFIEKHEGKRLRHRWRIILKLILKKRSERSEWMELAEDRVK